jgi:hypothetical protein
MANFYEMESEEEGVQAKESKYYDEEGKFKWDAKSSSDSEGEDEEDKDGEEHLEEEIDDDLNVWE